MNKLAKLKELAEKPIDEQGCLTIEYIRAVKPQTVIALVSALEKAIEALKIASECVEYDSTALYISDFLDEIEEEL